MTVTAEEPAEVFPGDVSAESVLAGRDLGRLGLKNIAEQFVFGRFGAGSEFGVDLGNHGGNVAAVLEVLDGMSTGDSGFHNFHGSGSKIVFRAQSDDRAARMENVADELKKRPPA